VFHHRLSPFIDNPFIDSRYYIPIVIAINSSLNLAERDTINNESSVIVTLVK